MTSTLKDILRGVLIIGFFISTLLLSAYSDRIFVSPDENAAFFFAKTFAETGTLSGTEPLNVAFPGLLHPRSMVSIGSALLPGSFLGLPIVTGILYAGFGDTAALLFTPLLAFFALFAWRRTLLVAWKDELLADLGAFFLLIHPAFWYYSGRVMMHNVSFVAFLIFAAALLIARPLADIRTRFSAELRVFECFLAGVFVGMALFLRTAEGVWVITGLVTLLLVYRRELGVKNILAIILGLLLMLGIIGYTNNMVYGSPLATGYTVKADVGETTTEVASVVPTLPEQVLSYFFPFGIHPRAIMRHEWQYEFWLYPWMAIPALIGFAFLLFRRFDGERGWKVFFVGTTLLAFWLGAVYGSWSFNDNPDPRLVTIGNSYLRYWLPLFVLASPFSAYGVATLYRFLKMKIAEKSLPLRLIPNVFLGVILACSFALSFHLVFYGNDGIVPTRAALDTFLEKRRKVFAHTERYAVIIVDRSDKYLFPYRRVITPLRSEKTYAALPKLTDYVPVYYFGITFPETDLAYLNEEKLKEFGLQIELVETVNDESLYRIKKIPNL